MTLSDYMSISDVSGFSSDLVGYLWHLVYLSFYIQQCVEESSQYMTENITSALPVKEKVK